MIAQLKGRIEGIGDFFLRDAHGVAARLAATGEGTFAVDASRSAI
jgi:hypothetical protein